MNVELANVIARIEDLPYYTSPPIQFTLNQAADLTLGTYPFLQLTKTAMGNTNNITDNTLLYVRNISFSCDIPEIDYQQALKLAAGTVDIPRFNMFFVSNALSPQMRNPLILQKYMTEQEYRLIMMPKQTPNIIKANVTGVLQQTAALAGVDEINAFIEVFVQEIVDDKFIAALKKDYPSIMRNL